MNITTTTTDIARNAGAPFPGMTWTKDGWAYKVQPGFGHKDVREANGAPEVPWDRIVDFLAGPPTMADRNVGREHADPSTF